jgi:hypothetical protein
MLNLIMEGGALRMDHPYDLPNINTGVDLLNFFEKAKKFIDDKNDSAVKIDGVNVSFKVVGDEDKQFAVDRGSLKEIDISGITMDRVDQRFPEGHGMRPAIKTLLTILNSAINDTEPELKKFGMWDDPSKFLNTEYVAGTTNVTAYDDNFFAIHGLNQFYEKTAKSGPSKDNYRPGLERPMVFDPKKKQMVPISNKSREIPYDPAVMNRLVKKLQPYAKEYGFEVYSSVPASKKEDLNIDFSDVLSQPFTVKLSDDREITKPLGDWLKEANIPRFRTVKLANGKKTHALHRQLYLNILGAETPVVDMIEDKDAEDAIYGAVIIHATRMLGNEILNALTSPMGDLTDHEGVVLRDEKLFGPNPVKITGEFIVGNLAGGFGVDDIKEEVVDAEQPEPAPVSGKSIALVPGSFKPPHAGHLAMVQQYAANHDEVLVLISRPLKKQRTLADGTVITATDAKKMWEILLGPVPNVDVQISDQASPIVATYEYIGNEGPLNPGDAVTLGCSSKGCDYKRWRGAGKYIKDGVKFKDPEATAVEPARHSQEYMNILSQSPVGENMPSVKDSKKDPADFHASDMRYLLGVATKMPEAVELLDDFTNNNTEMFLNILGIDTGLNEPLDEISSMAGGAVQGHSGKKRKKKKNEYYEPELYKEVLNLLIKKGIIQ